MHSSWAKNLLDERFIGFFRPPGLIYKSIEKPELNDEDSSDRYSENMAL